MLLVILSIFLLKLLLIRYYVGDYVSRYTREAVSDYTHNYVKEALNKIVITTVIRSVNVSISLFLIEKK